jgi:hypothetical protein
LDRVRERPLLRLESLGLLCFIDIDEEEDGEEDEEEEEEEEEEMTVEW